MTEGAELVASGGGGLSMAPVWKGGSVLRPGAGLDLILELDEEEEEDLEMRKLESVDEDDVEEIVDEGGLRLADAPRRPGGVRD